MEAERSAEGKSARVELELRSIVWLRRDVKVSAGGTSRLTRAAARGHPRMRTAKAM